MSKKLSVIENNGIQSRIFTIRGLQVMLDSDLAELYGVESKRLNEQVKRNVERFPEQFRFQLTQEELENLKSQFATSSAHGGRRTLPYVFTEQGVSMLSAVLRSETAIQVSIQIMNAFVGMRRWISDNAAIFQRLDSMEHKQQITDGRLNQVFEAIEANEIKPKQGIFFDGQVFDAYAFVCELIRSARERIVLIDNYVDESVLILLSKRGKKVEAKILTKSVSKQLALDIEKFNSQYPAIDVQTFGLSHDRFLIIDDIIYHMGASLKDLGKRWFAFSKMEADAITMLSKLEA